MNNSSRISRLPDPIRQQLNRRLDNFEPGKRILLWLNSIPEVQALLAAEFEGNPVSKQNLTKWKKSGFSSWQIRRDALQFAAEATLDPAAKSLSASITSSRLILIPKKLCWLHKPQRGV